MGCDIHMFVEVQDSTGVWRNIPPSGLAHQDDFDAENGWWDWYPGRSYALFAVLAGVRNADDVAPIADLRGVPADASEVVRDYMDDPCLHSRTHFTIRELLDFDWDAELHMPRRMCKTYRQAAASMLESPNWDIWVTMDKSTAVRLVFAFDN